MIRDFPGNYTEYRERKAQEEKGQKKEEAPPEKNQPIVYEPAAAKKKLSYKEKLEFDQLEKEIPKLESEKQRLTDLLNAGSADNEQIMKWSDEVGKVIALLDEKSMRWLELSENA